MEKWRKERRKRKRQIRNTTEEIVSAEKDNEAAKPGPRRNKTGVEGKGKQSHNGKKKQGKQ